MVYYSTKRKIVLGVSISISVLLLIGAILTIYFLYPRTPSVQQLPSNVQILQFNLTNSSVSFFSTVFIVVSNNNYVNMQLNSVTLNCIYLGITLGQLQLSNVVIPPNTNSNIPVPGMISSTNGTVVLGMNQQRFVGNQVTFEFTGPISLTYLSYPFSTVLVYAVSV